MAKTILITGCSSGFGQAAAERFAREGWNVIATMRNPADGERLAAHPNVRVARLDVSDARSVQAALAEGIGRFGGIDVLVNNAGYGLMQIFEGIPRAAIQQQFDVNVLGVMDVTRAVLPHFRARRSGVIINVSSGAGVFGAPMASVYSASKFALEGFSEALSYELASLGIRVKIIEPGGAPGTKFIARSASAAADTSQIADYAPFAEGIGRMYAGMVSGSDADATDKVVAAILEAATDGTDRLRYAPTSDIQPLLEARRSTSEARYQTLVRGLFIPGTAASS